MKQILSSFLLMLNFVSCKHPTSACANVKNGVFWYYSKPIHRGFLITRLDSLQIELDAVTKKISKNRINWINDCVYEIRNILDSSDPHDRTDSFFATTPKRVQIMQVTPKYYIFLLSIDSVGKSLHLLDTMEIVKLKKKS